MRSMMTASADPDGEPDPGLLSLLAGDGRAIIGAVALCLALAGGFAMFLALTGELLPHDAAYLGLGAADLCDLGACRVVDFMVHDRASFGGSLVAIGAIYAWLVAEPLRNGEAWAWWTLLFSGLLGFATFLGYLGYGYLDTWHGVATLLLLPVFVVGLVMTRRLVGPRPSPGSLLSPADGPPWRSRRGLGRGLILLTGIGMLAAGTTVLGIGTSVVFVPSDLEFIGRTTAELEALNPRLIPLLAHDRAGFGGGLATVGLAVTLAAWCGRPTRSQWEAFAVAGLAGFGSAIGIHAGVGYLDPIHVGPAVAGAAVLGVGLVLAWPGRPERSSPPSG